MMRFQFVILLLMLFSSCATTNRMMLGPVANILYDASFGAEEDINYENFRQGLMPQLKLAEAIWSMRREDRDILATLIKGYAGYALLINETDYLQDKLTDKEQSQFKDEAVYNYSQAIRYGMMFFKANGFDLERLVRASKEPNGIGGFLELYLSHSSRDLEAVMYTAQAMSGLINLQKGDMKLVAYASIAKEMYDWVCKNKPDMNLGACGIYYGAYEAARPKMLGGNPILGKDIFLKTIKKYPHNWFARVMFVEYYLIPMGDEVGYQAQRKFLIEAEERLKKAKKWNPLTTKYLSQLGDKKYRIYQIGAIERFKSIKKLENEIF